MGCSSSKLDDLPAVALCRERCSFLDEAIQQRFPSWERSFGSKLNVCVNGRCRAISVTMYNFGSPRVGNRRFAEVYNEKVKDSWRIINHRDIIHTVPRLMGYCHVAQPVYLTAGELKDGLENMELWKDGYQGDVIGEYTPDVLVTEFRCQVLKSLLLGGFYLNTILGP
uniref:Fungal lipase-like domain-containing protein n=1 Tax=Gossypium raimondii TaxID=29730 RepID=A0A0D2NP10_GOSRA|nr:hypothetical protein B456_002G165300 [Gossypium raimondii]